MKDGVFRIILSKSIVILAVSSLIVLAMGLFSVGGWTYAGFASAFLGAAYLLSAWGKFMRALGRRVLPDFRRALRLPSRGLRRAPYFHRKEKTDRPGIRSVGYHFEDSLEDEVGYAPEDRTEYGTADGTEYGVDDYPEYEAEGGGRLTEALRLKAASAAYAICGVVLLIASLFIY